MKGETITLKECDKYTVVTIDRQKSETGTFLKPVSDVTSLYLRSEDPTPKYMRIQLKYDNKNEPMIPSEGTEVSVQEVVQKRLDQFKIRKDLHVNNTIIPYWINKKPFFIDLDASKTENGLTYQRIKMFSISWVKQCAMQQPPANYEPVFESEWKTYRKKRIALASSIALVPFLIGAYVYKKMARN